MMIGTMDLLIGFIALVIVIIIETIYLSKALSNKWADSQISSTVILSNLISTVFGLFERQGRSYPDS